MTMKVFLKKLRTKISILNKEQIENEINKYQTIIQNKINSGLSEKEAVSSLGDIDSLANSIIRNSNIENNEEYEIDSLALNNTFNNSTINDMTYFIKKIVKFIVASIFIVPLSSYALFSIFIVGVLIYAIFIGLDLFGPLLIVIGVFLFIVFLLILITNLFRSEPKNPYIVIVISVMLFVFGITISINSFEKYEFIDKVNENRFTKTTEYKILQIEDITYMEDCNKIIDKNLKDNEVKIEYSYYKDVINVDILMKKSKIYVDSNEIYYSDIEMINIFLDDLKNKKIYNYERVTDVDVNVYMNNNTSNKFTCRADFNS